MPPSQLGGARTFRISPELLISCHPVTNAQDKQVSYMQQLYCKYEQTQKLLAHVSLILFSVDHIIYMLD